MKILEKGEGGRRLKKNQISKKQTKPRLFGEIPMKSILKTLLRKLLVSIKHSLFIAHMTGKVPEIGKRTGLQIEKKNHLMQLSFLNTIQQHWPFLSFLNIKMLSSFLL